MDLKHKNRSVEYFVELEIIWKDGDSQLLVCNWGEVSKTTHGTPLWNEKVEEIERDALIKTMKRRATGFARKHHDPITIQLGEGWSEERVTGAGRVQVTRDYNSPNFAREISHARITLEWRKDAFKNAFTD